MPVKMGGYFNLKCWKKETVTTVLFYGVFSCTSDVALFLISKRKKPCVFGDTVTFPIVTTP